MHAARAFAGCASSTAPMRGVALAPSRASARRRIAWTTLDGDERRRRDGRGASVTSSSSSSRSRRGASARAAAAAVRRPESEIVVDPSAHDARASEVRAREGGARDAVREGWEV